VVPPLTSSDTPDYGAVRAALERDLHAVLPTTAPAKPVSEAS
jgi:hypothetical protein